MTHSTWYIILFAGMALGGAAYLYWPRRVRRHYPKRALYVLTALRFGVIFGLLCLLLAPVWRRERKEKQPPLCVLATDVSNSMRGVWKDSLSRVEAYNTMHLLPEMIGAQAEWQTYAFGTHPRRTDVEAYVSAGAGAASVDAAKSVSMSAWRMDDVCTDYSKLLSQCYASFEKRSGAMVMISDGRYNYGRDPLSEPWSDAPIYVICVGDTTPYADWYIARWEQNACAYQGAEFPVKVFVEYRNEAGKAEGEAAKEAVTSTHPWLEIHKDGRMLRRKVLDADDMAAGVEFFLPATDTGMQTYEMVLRSAASERNTVNNHRNFYIEILNEKTVVRILTAETHPDLAAIKRALESDGRHEVWIHDMHHFKGRSSQQWDKLSADVWVLYGIPTSSISTDERNSFNRWVQEVPLWLICTPQTSSSVFNRMRTGVSFPSVPMYAEVGARYRKEFSNFELKSADKVEDFPPLFAPLGLEAEHGSILLYQHVGLATTAPLWWFDMDKGRRIAVLTGQGLWRWRMWEQKQTGNTALTDALIQRCVGLLAAKENNRRLQVQTERFYAYGMPVKMQADLYDVSGWRVSSADIRAVFRDSTNTVYKAAFTSSGDHYYLSASGLPTGTYTYEVTATYGDSKERQTGYFRVGATAVESSDMPADWVWMQKFASNFNGAVYHWDGHDKEALRRIAEQIEQAWAKHPANEVNVRKRMQSRALNQSIILLVVILLMMGAEYALRRRFQEV